MKPMLPKTVTQTLYIVAERTRTYDTDQSHQYKVHLTAYNPEKGSNPSGQVLLGTHEVTVGVPQVNPLTGEIEVLKKMRTEILAEAQGKANLISDRIQQLLCITHVEE